MYNSTVVLLRSADIKSSMPIIQMVDNDRLVRNVKNIFIGDSGWMITPNNELQY